MMCDMRQLGVRVDLDKAEQAKGYFKKKSKEIKDEIYRQTKIKVEPWAAASVATVFDELGLVYPTSDEAQGDLLRKSGVPSFTKQWLSANSHPVAQMIMKLREFDKAETSFIDSILKHEHKGRIHCEFHQLRSDGGGTVTGRFSSSNPNLQQISGSGPRDQEADPRTVPPGRGNQVGVVRLLEPRAEVTGPLCSKPEGGDASTRIVDNIVEEYNTGDVDLHQMVADLAGITRKEAKVVNLGIMYGMGKGKLGDQLGISTEEAGDLLQKHQDKVPFVKNLANLASRQAEKTGQIRTLLGRRCRFKHVGASDLWVQQAASYTKLQSRSMGSLSEEPLLTRR